MRYHSIGRGRKGRGVVKLKNFDVPHKNKFVKAVKFVTSTKTTSNIEVI